MNTASRFPDVPRIYAPAMCLAEERLRSGPPYPHSLQCLRLECVLQKRH